jgi:hypothetical protein
MARPPIGLQPGRCPHGLRNSHRARASGRKRAMTEKKRTAWQASLSIAGETIGAAFHSAAGRRYLAASVARGAAAKAPGMEQWLVEWMLDDQREKTIPFSTSWRSEWRATAFPRHSPGLFPRGDRRSEKRAAGGDDIGGLQFSSQLAACAVPGRHSCDAAAVRSFTLSMHSFTLSCCGQRLSPWTMPHDLEIFRNE